MYACRRQHRLMNTTDMDPPVPNCGDSCSLVDFTMAIAGNRFLPEERMKLAIEAVTSEKMSQRGAAEKFDVDRKTLSRHLPRVGQMTHPKTSQSGAGKSRGHTGASKEPKLTKEIIRSRLRSMCRDQGGAPLGFPQSLPKMRGWLQWAGVSIPLELQGKTESFNPSTDSSTNPPQANDTHQQGIYADNSVPVIFDGTDETEEEDRRSSDESFASYSETDHPAFADHLDIGAVREHVNREVQRSDRPADFKRAIELLTELDRICTDAWYRRHPEPWGHDDWAHVSSEIEALHSIVGQRAEETADDILRKSSAVKVNATVVC